MVLECGPVVGCSKAGLKLGGAARKERASVLTIQRSRKGNKNYNAEDDNCCHRLFRRGHTFMRNMLR